MMILRSHMFRRVSIIGVGFMGGSLGMALKKYRLAKEVIGISHRQSTLVQAIKQKAIDVAQTDIPKGVRGSDLVVLATPTRSIVSLLDTINPHLKRGCVVTDIGSAKSEIVEAAEKGLSAPAFFVGSHPLTGSEKAGIHNAYAELFEKSLCIMTPTKVTNQVAKEKVKFLWTKIGAEVKQLSAEEHDKILAYISHLPHLLAYGLIDVVPKEYLEYVTPGFRDSTRIAASSPQVWNDISLSNSKNVIKSLDDLIENMSKFRKAIVHSDQKKLTQYFKDSKEKRDALR